MFSSQNFLLNITPGDKLLKIRNTSGQLAHIIRDATCTIRQEGVMISIKQQSESQVISLDFITIEDASTAHILLREALKILGTPQPNQQNEYTYSPVSNSTVNVAFSMTIPIVVNICYGLYVNGILIPELYYSTQIAISGIETVVAWNTNALYILETTDEITIKYN